MYAGRKTLKEQGRGRVAALRHCIFDMGQILCDSTRSPTCNHHWKTVSLLNRPAHAR